MQLQGRAQEVPFTRNGAKYRGSATGLCRARPANWYACAKSAIKDAMYEAGANPEDVKAIGIAYQMHGLVCVNAQQEVETSDYMV